MILLRDIGGFITGAPNSTKFSGVGGVDQKSKMFFKKNVFMRCFCIPAKNVHCICFHEINGCIPKINVRFHEINVGFL